MRPETPHVIRFWRSRALIATLLGAALDPAIARAQAPAPPAPAAPDTATASAPASTAQGFRVLENRLTLREPFNQAADKVRIVAFLSPSCPRCLKNAGELQREVLEKNPARDLAVFLVWLKILDGDNEATVVTAKRRVSDPRAQHYWDPGRLLNAQLIDAIAFDINLRFYDIFLLYGKKAQWEKRLPRPGFWMHEYKGAPGPWWNITTFGIEIDNGLHDRPLTNPDP